MSFGAIFLALAFCIFFLLGIHAVDSTSKYNLDEIGFSFIALGILLAGIPLPWRIPPRQ